MWWWWWWWRGVDERGEWANHASTLPVHGYTAGWPLSLSRSRSMPLFLSFFSSVPPSPFSLGSSPLSPPSQCFYSPTRLSPTHFSFSLPLFTDIIIIIFFSFFFLLRRVFALCTLETSLRIYIPYSLSRIWDLKVLFVTYANTMCNEIQCAILLKRC